MACGKKVVIGVLIVTIILFVVALLVAFVAAPQILKGQVSEKVRLENGTKPWERFVEIPFPLKFTAHLFKVNNPTEILSTGKPEVEETGPYVYDQSRKKRNLELTNDDSLISYYQDQIYEFNETESEGKEDDVITILNVPLLSILQTCEGIPNDEELPLHIDINDAITKIFDEPNLFISTTAKKVMFDGIKFCDPTRLDIPSKIICLATMILKPRNVEYLDDGSMLFSLFKYKKDTHDGYYTINTGMSEIDDLGGISGWNNLKHTSFWAGENSECDEVSGYDSTIYPPFNNEDSKFNIFATDICRKVMIEFDKESEYKDTSGYRYVVRKDTLKVEDPKNSCYCLKKTKGLDGKDNCFMDGLMDLGSCLGVQTLLSFPHFLWADEKYGKLITGMNPSEDKHLTFVDLEPVTGTPLQGRKRVQINVVLRPITFRNEVVKITEMLPRVILPLVWIEEGVSLPDEFVDELHEEYFDKVTLLDNVKWSIIGITAALVIISIIWLILISK